MEAELQRTDFNGHGEQAQAVMRMCMRVSVRKCRVCSVDGHGEGRTDVAALAASGQAAAGTRTVAILVVLLVFVEYKNRPSSKFAAR